jgi:alpha-tubulin suppressor-like RCC1 family protein
MQTREVVYSHDHNRVAASPGTVVKKGYTEFFSWGNDEEGQLGHGHDGVDRKKMFNLPKSLSFEVLIKHLSCGAAHTAFISN